MKKKIRIFYWHFVLGVCPIFARINWTGWLPVIQVVAVGITVPAGDGVRGGIVPRTKLVEIFATDGGVWARIVPRWPIFVVTPEIRNIIENISIKFSSSLIQSVHCFVNLFKWDNQSGQKCFFNLASELKPMSYIEFWIKVF